MQQPLGKIFAQRGEATARAGIGVGVAACGETIAAPFVDGDQRRNRREGQLKARAERRLRLDGDDKEYGERQITHGERRAVEQHGGKHEQRHRQRALRSDARARGDVVENGADHGERRRPFLDRIIERQRARKRQQPPKADEEHAGDQRHLQAGNSDDVEDAGAADEVFGGVGQEIALARHHRRGDRAGVALQRMIDAQRQRIAQPVDSGEKAQRKRRGIGRRRDLDAPERVADAAQPREIGVAGEVVAAGQRRARRRQQPRLEADEVAGGEGGILARRQAHARRNHAAGKTFRAGNAQHEARAGAARIDLLDEAGEIADAEARDDRRLDARRAPDGGEEAAGNAGRDQQERVQAMKGDALALAREERENRSSREQRAGKDERLLALGGKIHNDAGAGGNRQPQKRLAQRDFFVQRGAERARQRPRARGEAGGERRPPLHDLGDARSPHWTPHGKPRLKTPLQISPDRPACLPARRGAL